MNKTENNPHAVLHFGKRETISSDRTDSYADYITWRIPITWLRPSSPEGQIRLRKALDRKFNRNHVSWNMTDSTSDSVDIRVRYSLSD